MEIITVAFATDNGKSFINRHFGDANYYIIYDLIVINYKKQRFNACCLRAKIVGTEFIEFL